MTETGETGIETIVAVRHPEPVESDQAIRVVSPCGSCRELIWDYDRNARVIVPAANGPAVVDHRRVAAEQIQPRADAVRIERDLELEPARPPAW